MSRNERTARTLAETTFSTGYPTMPRPRAKNNPVLNVLLATVIGVLAAALLVHWSAS